MEVVQSKERADEDGVSGAINDFGEWATPRSTLPVVRCHVDGRAPKRVYHGKREKLRSNSSGNDQFQTKATPSFATSPFWNSFSLSPRRCDSTLSTNATVAADSGSGTPFESKDIFKLLGTSSTQETNPPSIREPATCTGTENSLNRPDAKEIRESPASYFPSGSGKVYDTCHSWSLMKSPWSAAVDASWSGSIMTGCMEAVATNTRSLFQASNKSPELNQEDNGTRANEPKQGYVENESKNQAQTSKSIHTSIKDRQQQWLATIHRSMCDHLVTDKRRLGSPQEEESDVVGNSSRELRILTGNPSSSPSFFLRQTVLDLELFQTQGLHGERSPVLDPPSGLDVPDGPEMDKLELERKRGSARNELAMSETGHTLDDCDSTGPPSSASWSSCSSSGPSSTVSHKVQGNFDACLRLHQASDNFDEEDWSDCSVENSDNAADGEARRVTSSKAIRYSLTDSSVADVDDDASVSSLELLFNYLTCNPLHLGESKTAKTVSDITLLDQCRRSGQSENAPNGSTPCAPYNPRPAHTAKRSYLGHRVQSTRLQKKNSILEDSVCSGGTSYSFM
jgi:hypothetical protein